jgi:4-hydroxy-3-methylbut-2-en-1-yl diphosphate synthase IspG/GcpE
MRVSLSAEPEEEVRVGWEILKSLGIRHRGVRIISCPSCARQGFDVIRTVQALEERLEHIETPLTLSIIGCVVNGPGEALMTDLGVTGGPPGPYDREGFDDRPCGRPRRAEGRSDPRRRGESEARARRSRRVAF